MSNVQVIPKDTLTGCIDYNYNPLESPPFKTVAENLAYPDYPYTTCSCTSDGINSICVNGYKCTDIANMKPDAMTGNATFDQMLLTHRWGNTTILDNVCVPVGGCNICTIGQGYQVLRDDQLIQFKSSAITIGRFASIGTIGAAVAVAASYLVL